MNGRALRAAGLALGLALLAAAAPTMALEEPDYRVVRALPDGDGAIEIREYPPYTVVEVEVAGPADAAGGVAFPILAEYLFGRNRGERKLPMTAPVTQAATPVERGTTAPVTQAANGGGYVVRFVLPKGVTPDTAPEPLDPRVRVHAVAAQRVAAIRYSGTWSQSNYDEHLARLKAVVADAGLEAGGEPVYARYDAPFMPWFLRRNEIWLPLPGR